MLQDWVSPWCWAPLLQVELGEEKAKAKGKEKDDRSDPEQWQPEKWVQEVNEVCLFFQSFRIKWKKEEWIRCKGNLDLVRAEWRRWCNTRALSILHSVDGESFKDSFSSFSSSSSSSSSSSPPLSKFRALAERCLAVQKGGNGVAAMPSVPDSSGEEFQRKEGGQLLLKSRGDDGMSLISKVQKHAHGLKVHQFLEAGDCGSAFAHLPTPDEPNLWVAMRRKAAYSRSRSLWPEDMETSLTRLVKQEYREQLHTLEAARQAMRRPEGATSRLVQTANLMIGQSSPISQVWAVQGPAGCGKSSWLRELARRLHLEYVCWSVQNLDLCEHLSNHLLNTKMTGVVVGGGGKQKGGGKEEKERDKGSLMVIRDFEQGGGLGPRNQTIQQICKWIKNKLMTPSPFNKELWPVNVLVFVAHDLYHKGKKQSTNVSHCLKSLQEHDKRGSFCYFNPPNSDSVEKGFARWLKNTDRVLQEISVKPWYLTVPSQTQSQSEGKGKAERGLWQRLNQAWVLVKRLSEEARQKLKTAFGVSSGPLLKVNTASLPNACQIAVQSGDLRQLFLQFRFVVQGLPQLQHIWKFVNRLASLPSLGSWDAAAGGEAAQVKTILNEVFDWSNGTTTTKTNNPNGGNNVTPKPGQAENGEETVKGGQEKGKIPKIPEIPEIPEIRTSNPAKHWSLLECADESQSILLGFFPLMSWILNFRPPASIPLSFTFSSSSSSSSSSSPSSSSAAFLPSSPFLALVKQSVIPINKNTGRDVVWALHEISPKLVDDFFLPFGGEGGEGGIETQRLLDLTKQDVLAQVADMVSDYDLCSTWEGQNKVENDHLWNGGTDRDSAGLEMAIAGSISTRIAELTQLRIGEGTRKTKKTKKNFTQAHLPLQTKNEHWKREVTFEMDFERYKQQSHAARERKQGMLDGNQKNDNQKNGTNGKEEDKRKGKQAESESPTKWKLQVNSQEHFILSNISARTFFLEVQAFLADIFGSRFMPAFPVLDQGIWRHLVTALAVLSHSSPVLNVSDRRECLREFFEARSLITQFNKVHLQYQVEATEVEGKTKQKHDSGFLIYSLLSPKNFRIFRTTKFEESKFVEMFPAIHRISQGIGVNLTTSVPLVPHRPKQVGAGGTGNPTRVESVHQRHTNNRNKTNNANGTNRKQGDGRDLQTERKRIKGETHRMDKEEEERGSALWKAKRKEQEHTREFFAKEEEEMRVTKQKKKAKLSYASASSARSSTSTRLTTSKRGRSPNANAAGRCNFAFLVKNPLHKEILNKRASLSLL